ncbi:MAG: dTMP kinase [Clostridiales bacterium]|nr:dTMP kinase [Clostridiales bacterium]
MKKGKFIVFEGVDGSGKSTQSKLLAEYLASKGISCRLTREPTDSPIGALARQCMTGRITADERTISALFAADRLDHLYNDRDGILGLIDRGISVISDRYYFSSYAYHGVHLDMKWVIETNRLSAEVLRPDINIYLDIEPDKAIMRLGERGSLERYEKLDNIKKVRDKYFEAFELLKDSENVVVIKSLENYLETAESVKKAVEGLF